MSMHVLGASTSAVSFAGRAVQHRARTTLRVNAAVKKSKEKHVVCSKTLIAVPASISNVKDLCLDITKFSKAQALDRENGIRAFECMQDSWETNVFHFFEEYESNSHMGRHNTTDEFQKFMQQVQPHLEKPVGMTLYESKGGLLGASALQGGPKGEGGLDDATGASGAASASSMKQTSATIDLTKSEEDDEDLALASELKRATDNFAGLLKNMFGGLTGKK